MKNNKIVPALAFVAVMVGTEAPLVAAAPQLEEVIVTAQKRAENMQDVPVAVSAITSEQLDDIGFNDIADIAAQVPSLIVLTNLSPLSTTFRVRNIGNAGNIPTFEPATGLFIDGAFRSRSGIGIGDLADVQSVEVLKGPQSTLHGKNVTAGVISVKTKGPTREFEAMAELNGGSDGLRQFKGYVSGPLTDWLAARLSLVDTRRDELVENVLGPDSDTQNSYAIRAQFQADFSERFSGRLILGYAEKDLRPMTGDVFLSDASREVIDNAGGQLTIPNDPSDRTVEYGDEITFESESNDVVLNLEYGADAYTLTSITSYDDYESLNGIHDVEQQSLFVADFNDVQIGDSFSQELRIASNDGLLFNWLAGAFYYTNSFIRGDRDLPEFIIEEDADEYGDAVADALISQGVLPTTLLPVVVPVLGVPGDRGDYYIEQDTESFGLFSKLDFSFSERWKMSLGLRYSYEEKTGKVNQSNQTSPLGCVPPLNTNLICAVTPNGNNFDQTNDFDAVTGSLSGSFFLTPDTMFYASLATGFKAGGFSLQNGTATDDTRPFGEERVSNIEIGAKSEFWDRRARINAALFHTEYRDFQNASFVGLVFVINNAELVTVDGIEIDSTFIITESLSANLNVAYIDTVYDEYKGGQCFYGREPDNALGQCDLSGEHLPTAVELKTNLALNWRYPLLQGDLYTRLDYLYKSEANSSASLDPRFDQASLGEFNLRVGWRDADWDIAFWGRNLTDEVYISQAAPANIHTAVDRNLNSPVGSYQAYTRPPRTWGATMRYYF